MSEIVHRREANSSQFKCLSLDRDRTFWRHEHFQRKYVSVLPVYERT